MILRWSPFKIVSISAILYPRWPPLLKIEISSNGQNCSILSLKVPKFELYKHNDELFNIYYKIYCFTPFIITYVLFIFTATRDCDRRCHDNHERLKKGFGSIVMKLYRNVFGMCSCEFRIIFFQDSHSCHGNHEC